MPTAAIRPAGLDPDGAQPWSLATRVAFRFAFLYFLLYGIPPLLVDLWGLSWLGQKFQEAWAPLVYRVGGAVFGIELPPLLPNGSGDQLYHYAELVCTLLVAGLGTIAWSLADRRRAHHRDLAELLRIYLRYLLAFIMLAYGMLKVLKSQFPQPSPARLVTPVGDLSPMGLLWTFMGHSTAYTLFAGLAEVVGATLLLFRRTTTAGALVLFGVLSNVVVLNYAYDVPVKLFSTHLLLITAILVAPDLRRVFDALVRNRATAPVDLGAPPVPARWRRALPIAKGLVIAAMLVDVFWAAFDGYREFGDGSDPIRHEGVYRVVGVGAAAEPEGWRRVGIGRRMVIAVTADGDVIRFRLVDLDPALGTLELADVEDPRRTGRLTATTHGDELHLAGEVAGAPVALRLRRIPDGEILLPRRDFHWVNDSPFNR